MYRHSEEMVEAIKVNMDYLESETLEDFIAFLEAVGESLYDGVLIEELASALRDVVDGLEG